jgi:hypothetical protein
MLARLGDRADDRRTLLRIFSAFNSASSRATPCGVIGSFSTCAPPSSSSSANRRHDAAVGIASPRPPSGHDRAPSAASGQEFGQGSPIRNVAGEPAPCACAPARRGGQAHRVLFGCHQLGARLRGLAADSRSIKRRRQAAGDRRAEPRPPARAPNPRNVAKKRSGWAMPAKPTDAQPGPVQPGARAAPSRPGSPDRESPPPNAASNAACARRIADGQNRVGAASPLATGSRSGPAGITRPLPKPCGRIDDHQRDVVMQARGSGTRHRARSHPQPQPAAAIRAPAARSRATVTGAKAASSSGSSPTSAARWRWTDRPPPAGQPTAIAAADDMRRDAKALHLGDQRDDRRGLAGAAGMQPADADHRRAGAARAPCASRRAVAAA